MLRVNGSSLADDLRAARGRAALSQEELASKLGVSTRSIQGWEAGRIPQPKFRRRVLEFLKEEAA